MSMFQRQHKQTESSGQQKVAANWQVMSQTHLTRMDESHSILGGYKLSSVYYVLTKV